MIHTHTACVGERVVSTTRQDAHDARLQYSVVVVGHVRLGVDLISKSSRRGCCSEVGSFRSVNIS